MYVPEGVIDDSLTLEAALELPSILKNPNVLLSLFNVVVDPLCIWT